MMAPQEPDSHVARFKRWFATPSFWVAAIALLWSYPIISTAFKPLPDDLPRFGAVPEFSLTDQFGRDYGSEQLRGRVWIANFIFTRCPTICPRFSKKMAEVQHRSRHAADSLHLVSFSVDPEYDTPEVLLAYSKGYRASPRIWTFLTGGLEAIEKVVVQGLKSAMGNDGVDGNIGGIFHGSHFVLIGPNMQIRGYYHAEDEDVTDRLMQHAHQLLNMPAS